MTEKETIRVAYELSLDDYEKKYFSDTPDIRHGVAKPSIIRNGVCIGLMELDEIKVNTNRSDWKGSVRCAKVRTQILFTPICNQNNILDEIFGTQCNKNQMKSINCPKQMIRTIEFCITDTSNKLFNYYNEIKKKL